MAFLNGTDPSLRQTRTPTVDTFTAGVGFTAGSSTTVTLSSDPGTENNVIISFDGIVQHRTEYSVSGTTVTFTAAIPSAVAAIEATYTTTMPANEPADGSVTIAKLAASGTKDATTFLRGDNSFAVPAAGFTLGTEQATTSGTTITFTGIPSGVKMVVVMLESVSFTGSANLKLTLGSSGGLETSGYASATMRGSTNIFDSAAFVMYMQGQGANTVSGSIILTLKDATNYDWVAQHAGGSDSGSAGAFAGGGHKSLSGELTQLQLSGGTFDNGSANILYM